MVPRLTISVDDDVSLKSEAALRDGYRQMAEDVGGEAEAAEWVDALLVDAARDDN